MAQDRHTHKHVFESELGSFLEGSWQGELEKRLRDVNVYKCYCLGVETHAKLEAIWKNLMRKNMNTR